MKEEVESLKAENLDFKKNYKTEIEEKNELKEKIMKLKEERLEIQA